MSGIDFPDETHLPEKLSWVPSIKVAVDGFRLVQGLSTLEP